MIGPANFLGLIATPLNLVLSARTTRRSDDPTFPPRVAGALRLIAVVTSAAGAAAAVAAPWLLPFVFGERFREAVEPFWLLIPGVLAFSLVRIVNQYLAGAKRPQWNTGISATGAVFTVGLSLWWIPR